MGFWDKEFEGVIIELPGKDGNYIEIKVAKMEKTGAKWGVDIRKFWTAANGEVRPGRGIFVPVSIARDVAQTIHFVLDQAADEIK